jgi:DNA-binding NarL/FixJ family response regulator
LSAREAEVLGLVARGLTNAQIAKELFISPRTVNRHLNSIYQKIGAGNLNADTIDGKDTSPPGSSGMRSSRVSLR